MGRHTVNVPDYACSSRRLMTAGQWLAEFRQREAGEKSQVHILPAPVRVAYVENDEHEKQSVAVRTSTGFFSLLARIAHGRGVIVALSWRGARIGAQGLYALNHANKTGAVRKNGLNIVRHWLETRTGHRTPLRGDVAELLSYLEIRPIFRAKTAVNHLAESTPSSVPATGTLDIMSIIHTARYQRLE